MSTLFHNNIRPLVEKVQVAASETISEVSTQVHATIDHLNAVGKEMISFAGQQAK